MTLTSDTTINALASAGGTVNPNVTFAQTVDTQTYYYNTYYALTVNDPGTTWFEANVGATMALASITTTTATTKFGTGAVLTVTTAGNQTYTDSTTTTVPANATLTSTTGNLSVTSSGGIDIAGTMIAIAPAGTVTLTEKTADIEEDPLPPGTPTGIISANVLITSSKTGTLLNGANTVNIFSAGNATGGDIQLTNTASTLTIGQITNMAGGCSINSSNNITVGSANLRRIRRASIGHFRYGEFY